jgi:hypothetical protein
MTPHVTTDKKGVGVAVDATDTVLDTIELKSGATGVEWQVANDDIRWRRSPLQRLSTL